MTAADHANTVRALTDAIEHWVREQTNPLSTPESRTEAKKQGRVALDALQAQAEAAEARVTELEATRPEARYAAAMRVVALIRLAHDRHLATGDYITLGIAAQDALSEFDRAVLSAREEQK